MHRPLVGAAFQPCGFRFPLIGTIFHTQDVELAAAGVGNFGKANAFFAG